MGLDMFLLRRTPTVDDHSYDEAAYWRKANHIHKWFVDNVQGGVDDCGFYPVTKEQIGVLLALCHELTSKISLKDGKLVASETLTKEGWQPNLIDGKVVANPQICEELLPTQGGFFFGGTEYDQWYLESLDNTITQLTAVMKEEQDVFYYHSSW